MVNLSASYIALFTLFSAGASAFSQPSASQELDASLTRPIFNHPLYDTARIGVNTPLRKSVKSPLRYGGASQLARRASKNAENAKKKRRSTYSPRKRGYGGGSGRATYYNTGLGSCGKMNTDTDLIVALSPGDYAGGIHCDRNVRITDTKTGHTETAMVRDTCPGCAPGALDMSPALFQRFNNLGVGVFNIKWEFV